MHITEIKAIVPARDFALSQRFYRDLDEWWAHVQAGDLAARYGVCVEPPAEQPWGMRDNSGEPVEIGASALPRSA